MSGRCIVGACAAMASRPFVLGCAMLFAATACPAADAVPVVEGLGFPEGTLFVGSTLWFVDYQSSDVLRVVDGKATRVWHGDGCGANGLIATADGLLVACYDSGAIAVVSTDGKPLSVIDRDDRGAAFEHPNDFAADRRGGIYFTASGEAPRSGKVYYIARGAKPHEVAADIDYANGVVVSPDGGTLFVGASKTDDILRFAIATDGTLGARSVFVNMAKFARGHAPDGIRIDGRGHLFVALYDGAGLVVVDAGGKLTAQIDLPGVHHTNLALEADGKHLVATAIGAAGGAIVRVVNPVP